LVLIWVKKAKNVSLAKGETSFRKGALVSPAIPGEPRPLGEPRLSEDPTPGEFNESDSISGSSMAYFLLSMQLRRTSCTAL
jgi:hypothetical protein